MEISYWQSRWEKNNIGFHNPSVNQYLIQFADRVIPSETKIVFVPLCGKTKDLLWFNDLGFKTIGVEAVELACIQFFEENDLKFDRFSSHGFSVFKSGLIEIWCGSYFSLPSKIIASADVIYDRASLVALPTAMRKKYVEKMLNEAKSETSIMIHAFTYDQLHMSGPPFSVPNAEIVELYAAQCTIETLFDSSVLDRYERYKTKGLNDLTEQVYHVVKK